MSFQSFQRTKLGDLATIMGAILAAWLLAEQILLGANYVLISLAIILASIVLIQTLKNWRRGVLFFLVWMLFEDLVRKNLGNNMAVYFGKDVLAAACYLSFYVTRG